MLLIGHTDMEYAVPGIWLNSSKAVWLSAVKVASEKTHVPSSENISTEHLSTNMSSFSHPSMGATLAWHVVSNFGMSKSAT